MSTRIRYINGAPNAPQAVGPYSQATIYDNLVYLSGQIPLDPKTGQIVEGSVEVQAEQVLKNLLAVLGHMSMDFTHVLKTTIFLTDINDFHKVNNVYSKWMGEVRPARATIQVAGLPLGALVEIEMVAVLELQDEALLGMGGESVAMQEYSRSQFTSKQCSDK